MTVLLRHLIPLIVGMTNDVLTGAAGFNKTHVQVRVISQSLRTLLIYCAFIAICNPPLAL